MPERFLAGAEAYPHMQGEAVRQKKARRPPTFPKWTSYSPI